MDGFSGDHVIVAPPYNVTAAQVDEIVDQVAAMVATALAGLG